MSGITSEITYQNVTVSVSLEYNSGNRGILDPIGLESITTITFEKSAEDNITLTDIPQILMELGFTDSIQLSDNISITVNDEAIVVVAPTSVLNTHALNTSTLN